MKSIRIAVVYLLAGLLGGLAVSAMWSDDADDIGARRAEPEAAVEQRLAALERRVETVLADNARLVAALEDADRASVAAPAATDSSVEADADARSRVTNMEEAAEGAAVVAATERGGALRRLRDRDRSVADQLTAAGFSAGDAQLIETRIEELRVEAMQARYEAMRSGEPADTLRGQLADSTTALRSELGDDQYERFLEATGRPTSVNVSGVLARSAAETAGLQDGDQIVAYGGDRVFDIRDLNRVLLEGDPGEPVVVDVVRGGQPMQIVMPRGPLGISSGFTRRGPR